MIEVRATVLAAALLVACGGSQRARPPCGDDGPCEVLVECPDRSGGALFDEGVRQLEAGRYDDAVRSLRCAHREAARQRLEGASVVLVLAARASLEAGAVGCAEELLAEVDAAQRGAPLQRGPDRILADLRRDLQRTRCAADVGSRPAR
jgi:hypothetical protein